MESQRHTRIHSTVRRSCLSHLPLHLQGDDNEGTDSEEEEFYREYESQYSSSDNGEDESESSSNRKAELAKAWDVALTDQSIEDSDTGEAERISNLSDLQQKVQQIQQRNSKGPLEGYSTEENDSEQDTLEVRETRQQVAGDSLMKNEQYSKILQKAQERLSKLTDSESDSKIFQKTDRKTLVSNMSSLQERLNEIQREASEKEEEPQVPKYLDDDTLAEWEELDNQLQKEALERSPPASILQEPTQEDMLPDEAAILDALRAHAANNRYDSDDYDYDDDMDDEDSTIYSNVDGEENVDPNSIPVEYKKFLSDYEITEDGVFLSQEAYLEASNNVNPDGSLNFGPGETDGVSSTRASTLQSKLLDDEPPMAPYTGTDLSKEVTIKDLAEEASRSLEFARNNPEAQEELHRRIIAEFEAEEPTSNAFETELLLDPEKAFAFWNQQYMEERKVEVDALEDLLDQKMRELQQEQGEREGDTGNKGPLGRTMDSQKQSSTGNENIFFASKEERINRIRMIERDRREHAKNIARFYKESEKDSSWESTPEAKEIEEINRRQSLQEEDSESTIEETTVEIFEEDAKDKTSISVNNNNEEMSVDADNQEEEEEEWIVDEDPEWVFVEDPESPEDSFYWNEATSEMRRDPPEGF